jgi:hypothetical protein
MTTRISRQDIRKSFQGKNIDSDVRGKIGEYFNDSFSSGEVKDKLASELANRTKLSRKRKYREMGLNEDEREEIENFLSNNDLDN